MKLGNGDFMIIFVLTTLAPLQLNKLEKQIWLSNVDVGDLVRISFKNNVGIYTSLDAINVKFV